MVSKLETNIPADGGVDPGAWLFLSEGPAIPRPDLSKPKVAGLTHELAQSCAPVTIAVSDAGNHGHVLYLAESKKYRLLTSQIDAGGRLFDQAERVVSRDILAGAQHDVFTPDGVRLDKHGRLFVGLYEGGGFAVLTGDRTLLQKLELPGSHHASLAVLPDGQSVFVTATYDIPDGSGRGDLLMVENPVVE